MLGKTFKGMTDEMLAWQTERSSSSRPRGRRTSSTSGPSRWRWPSTASRPPAATRPGWPCASPVSCATATTSLAARGGHDHHGPVPAHRGGGTGRVRRVQLAVPRGIAWGMSPVTSQEDRRPSSAAAVRRRLREKEILDATRAPSTTRGVRDAQIEDIARSVGINRAIIYRHFSGKEELFALTLVGYLDELEAGPPPPTTRAPPPPHGCAASPGRSSTTASSSWPSWTAPRR